MAFFCLFLGQPRGKQKELSKNTSEWFTTTPDFTFTPLRLPFGGKKESGWILERQGDGWIERDGAFSVQQGTGQKPIENPPVGPPLRKPGSDNRIE